MTLKSMLDFDDFENPAACWNLIKIKNLLENDHFPAACWILMILKKMLDFA